VSLVPRRLIWVNEPGIGRSQRHAEGVAAFMGILATKRVLLPPMIPSPRAWWNAATEVRNLGGASQAIAARTVFREILNVLAMALIPNPSARCSLLISAQSSTLNNSLRSSRLA